MKRALLGVAVGVFLVAIAVSWATHNTGLIRNDLSRNVYVPPQLTMPLQVKAAYNGRDIFFRYRWPADRPSLYHDMLKYEGGKWVRIGDSVPGPQAEGIYEDRLTMMVDDGGVPEFARYGGYVAIGDRMRFFTNQASAEEVSAHPYLGQRLKQTEVGKYLPATRRDRDDWASVVPEGELKRLRQAGYFLDLWHWRAHRSNPVDKSDDQVIAEARLGDSGKGPFFTNWNAKSRQPALMFDPGKNGGYAALKWDDLAQKRLGFDDVYYLREEQAVAFDPNRQWRDGDTIPRRVLRAGEGSASDISVVGGGRWKDGFWDVTLVRRMDTGAPLEDKALIDKRVYNVAFGVHRHNYGSRWHNVSLPVTLGLDRDAELRAVRFEGDAPNWEQPWFEATLFYPGQVSWPQLNSRRHAGAERIKQGVPVRYRHSEIQLANYGIEMEFYDEIRRQWVLTLIASLALVAAFGLAINWLLPRKEA